MNYIVIDLEWNQCPTGEKEVVEFPFEIVEIGAVKLDENRNFVDEFHELVCPQVYKELHPKTNEIIHIDIEELKKGSPFCEVMKRFLNWCGNDYSFATWGMTDLFEIQRNMTYYQMEPLSNKPFFYYDIQKLFSLQTEGKKNARTLEYAVDYWAIEKNDKFHRALWDAEYTAKVFQKIDSFLVENYFSIDYYHNPKTEQEEVFVSYGTYSKFISREYKSKEELMKNSTIQDVFCHECGAKASKKIRWFSSNLKNYYCLFYCKRHGYLKGRLRIYKTKEGKVFAVKIVSKISEEKANLLKEKYREVCIHKQRKRKTRT